MNLMRRVRIWAGRIGLGRKIAIALAIPALASGVATYLALTGAPPFGPHPNAVLSLLNLDLVLLLALGAVVAKRLIEVWAERRRGLAGSRLQIRLVVLFSLIAVTPTIIVAVFSYLFFSFGIESWFSDKVRTAISESLAVAEAYLHEHQQAIRADVLAMANDLNRDAVKLALNPQHLEQVVSAQAALRGLTEAVVFDRAGHMLARSSLVVHSRLRTGPRRRDAPRRRRRRGDHDQRQRRSGASPRPAQSVRRCLSLCRPVHRAPGSEPYGGDPACGRAIRAAGRPALGLSDHLRADLHDGGDAVPGRRGGDRHPFRDPARGTRSAA